MSELIKVEASELEGAALDWAVATLRGGEYKPFQFACNEDAPFDDAWVFPDGSASTSYQPSTDWAQGGPLIEQLNLTVEHWHDQWFASCPTENGLEFGYAEEFLIAAMRAIVAAELGDTVEVPKELVT